MTKKSMNVDANIVKTPKIIWHVLMEYKDGSKDEFFNEDAEEWLDACNNAAFIASIHEMNQPLVDFWRKHGNKKV